MRYLSANKSTEYHSQVLLVIAAFVFIAGALLGSEFLMAIGFAVFLLFLIARGAIAVMRRYQETPQQARGAAPPRR